MDFWIGVAQIVAAIATVCYLSATVRILKVNQKALDEAKKQRELLEHQLDDEREKELEAKTKNMAKAAQQVDVTVSLIIHLLFDNKLSRISSFRDFKDDIWILQDCLDSSEVQFLFTLNMEIMVLKEFYASGKHETLLDEQVEPILQGFCNGFYGDDFYKKNRTAGTNYYDLVRLAAGQGHVSFSPGIPEVLSTQVTDSSILYYCNSYYAHNQGAEGIHQKLKRLYTKAQN